MVNRWSITNVSRAPGSQGLRDCAREYSVNPSSFDARRVTVYSRVCWVINLPVQNSGTRTRNRDCATAACTAAETLGARGSRFSRARSTRAGDEAGPPEAEHRPDHAPPRLRPHLRRVGAGRGKDARGGRAAPRRRPRPGRERGTNSIDATTRLAGRDAGRDETAWPIRLLQSAIDRDRANSYPGALTCTSRGVIILWSGTRDPTRRGAFWYRTRSPFRFVFGRAGDPQIRRSRCARQSP